MRGDEGRRGKPNSDSNHRKERRKRTCEEETKGMTRRGMDGGETTGRAEGKRRQNKLRL